MSMQAIIKNAVVTAFNVIGDLKKNGELLTKINEHYDPVTDSNFFEITSSPFEAVELDTEQISLLRNQEGSRDNLNVSSIEFYILVRFIDSTSERPKLDDDILLNGEKFQIKYVEQIRPGSETLLWTIGVAR